MSSMEMTKTMVGLSCEDAPKKVGVVPTKRGLLARGSKPVGIGGRPQLAEEMNHFIGEDGKEYETRLPVTEKTRAVGVAEQRERARAAEQRKQRQYAERAANARLTRELQAL